MTTWFCDAYASWQKGGIENANGRLRRWLPRHLDIDRTSDREIQEIVLTTNLTPRKCLGFKTPFQALISDAVWSWGSVCVGGNGRRKGAFSACLQISSPPPLSCWLNWTKQSACATKPPKPAHKRPLGSPLLRYHL